MKKFRRILSTFLTLAMVISCFTGFSVQAEDEAVSVKYKGVTIDGVADMPIEFSATINFPTPLAADVDLSEIELWNEDLETVSNVAITPVVTTTTDELTGTTTSQVYTATMQTPVLNYGEEYTVFVPDDIAESGMAGCMLMFTTIAKPYLFSEDFDGDVMIANEWKKSVSSAGFPPLDWQYGKFENGAAVFSNMTSSSSETRYDFKTNLNLASTNEAVIETKVKFTKFGTGYLLSDNSIYSGGRELLDFIGGNNSYVVDYLGLKTTKNGYVTFGGNSDHNEISPGATVTDYKLYANTWYTIRFTLSNDRKYVKLFIADENGRSYESGFVKGSNNGLQNIDYIQYPYSYFMQQTYVDYLKIWENDGLGTVNATYGESNLALSGAKDVDADSSVSAKLYFENAVSEADLAKIVLPGRTSSVTLSADGKQADVTISGMDYGTVYSLSVPEIAGNKASTFLFETEGAPIPKVTYGDNLELDGAEGVSEEFTAKITFGKPIATDLDVSGITLSGGNIKTKIIDSKTVEVAVSGLEKRTKYTLTIPDMGENPGTTCTFTAADEEWYIWRAEFDGKDATVTESGVEYLSEWYNWHSSSKSRIKTAKVSNGVLNPARLGGPQNLGAVNNLGSKIPSNTVIVWETRMKHGRVNNNGVIEEKDAEGNSTGKYLLDDSQGLLRLDTTGPAIFAKNGYLVYGTTWGCNRDKSTLTDYKLYADTFYTYKLEINTATAGMRLTVSNDEQGSWTSGWVSGNLTNVTWGLWKFGYEYHYNITVDYTRIYDDGKMPKAQATWGENNETLARAGKMKSGEEIKVFFEFGITEEELDAIKLDGETVDATISQDGCYATFTLPEIAPRSLHTLTIDAVGETKGNEFTFRGADEGKYLYRAEFDGNDDDSVWKTANGNQLFDETNSSAALDKEAGTYTVKFSTHTYRTFMPVFNSVQGQVFNGTAPLASHAIDCTDKESVVIETRFKVGEGTLDNQFLYLGDNIAMLQIGTNRELRYNGDAGSGKGTPFMVNDAEFTIEPDVWYTVKFNFNFVTQKYNVSVDNGMGDIASSGALNFIYNAKKFEIKNFRFARMLSNSHAPLTLDYFRIINEDFGKAKITYGSGYELNNAATIDITGNTFTIKTENDVTTTNGIVIKDEDGNEVEIECVASGKTITVTQKEAFGYNTKYTLVIPGNVIGFSENQTVNFTTAWDKTAEFEYPAGYSKDDVLNVAFFGGSITAMDGWRVYTTDWIKKKFPNANCYNASIGGTGSQYGWTRLNKDVISKNPDIVFVEFAVNDSTSATTKQYMESIVRNLNGLNKKPVIIFVYTTSIDFNTNAYTILQHEELAAHYGIPSINIHDYAQSLYNTDSEFATDWNNKVYLEDGTHPSAAGNQLYGEYVTALLESESSKYFVKPAENSSVSALTDYKDYVYSYKNIDKTLTVADNTYSAAFTGTEFILWYKQAATGGILEVVIDGDETTKVKVDTCGTSYPFMHSVNIDGLENKEHTVTVTMLKDEVSGSVVQGYQQTLVSCMYWAGKSSNKFEKPVFSADEVKVNELLTATVNYTSYSTEPVYLAIALYDINGRLTRISKLATTTDSTGVERTVSVSITPKTGDVKAKAFIWDSVTGMKALAENAAIGF